ncbi:hypothetical protein OGAPHI_001229 [Ogataea philodendri]|uniref:Uncharacterized protein n=1 Tax=Ogataea philodendri TaxID=1378263 RepID=A0A9P8T9L2_9ASCO|nr:uncharacterized protein OGAPHI_001229 [Ogataea philodendri]KAH3670714.1 hypothetical protein OGAPHI_001229 [Ogataea philodendri]
MKSDMMNRGDSSSLRACSSLHLNKTSNNGLLAIGIEFELTMLVHGRSTFVDANNICSLNSGSCGTDWLVATTSAPLGNPLEDLIRLGRNAQISLKPDDIHESTMEHFQNVWIGENNVQIHKMRSKVGTQWVYQCSGVSGTAGTSSMDSLNEINAFGFVVINGLNGDVSKLSTGVLNNNCGLAMLRGCGDAFRVPAVSDSSK